MQTCAVHVACAHDAELTNGQLINSKGKLMQNWLLN